MTIGAITRLERVKANRPRYLDEISFTGEPSYLAGGMPMGALFAAKAGDGREIVKVSQGDCGGYICHYIRGTGKLKVYHSNSDSADGPLIEVPDATNLGAVTFNLIVESI